MVLDMTASTSLSLVQTGLLFVIAKRMGAFDSRLNAIEERVNRLASRHYGGEV